MLLAVALGLAIKTPVVPFHTWLPPAHTDAPAAGSAILAGVLLKMGTYGFVRIAMPMLPGTWRRYALVFVIVGVVSVVYGALVALAQANFKRMIAYTVGQPHGLHPARRRRRRDPRRHGAPRPAPLAITGAVTQMVSHGLLTGALFLLSGVLYDRGRTYDMAAYSGLAGRTPVFAAVTAVAAFGCLGLPGLSGFIAEFQIFTGSLATAAVATAIAVTGILITAALFLRALQRIFLGPLRLPGGPGTPAAFGDLTATETAGIVPLLALAVVIGIAPRFLLDVIEPAARTLIDAGGAVNQNLGPLAPELILAASAVAGLLAGSWLPRHRQWLGPRCWPRPPAWPRWPPPGLHPGRRRHRRLRHQLCHRHRHQRRPRRRAGRHPAGHLPVRRRHCAAHPRETEFYVLLQLAALGTIVLAGANDLLLLFAGYLLASIPGYALAGFRKDAPGTEAALKYYLIGALLGVFMLAGITLLYGAGRTTSYPPCTPRSPPRRTAWSPRRA